MSVWVMPSVDVYKNFLKRSQAVAGGRRRWAPPTCAMQSSHLIKYENPTPLAATPLMAYTKTDIHTF